MNWETEAEMQKGQQQQCEKWEKKGMKTENINRTITFEKID